MEDQRVYLHPRIKRQLDKLASFRREVIEEAWENLNASEFEKHDQRFDVLYKEFEQVHGQI
jgi:hypothetical protein